MSEIKETRVPAYEDTMFNMFAAKALDPIFVFKCFLDELWKDKTQDERDRLVQKIALENDFYGPWQDTDYEDYFLDCDSNSSVDVD